MPDGSRGRANWHVGHATVQGGNPQTVIYVVVDGENLNDRVAKLVGLEVPNAAIVLVQPGKGSAKVEKVEAKPYPNPTGVLSFLGLRKVKQSIDRLLFFPSSKILLVKAITRALRKRIAVDVEQGRSIVLLTCLPPHDLCLVGLSLKQSFRQIYWLVDWQDLWSYDDNYLERIVKPHRRRLFNLERCAQGGCDMNITTNAYAKAVLEEHYGVPADRVIAIPHHFSADDLNGRPAGAVSLREVNRAGAIRIGFLGTLFKPPRVPGDLIHEALRHANASGLRVELHIHGQLPKHVGGETMARMHKDGLVFHGPSNHRESLMKLLHYDFLLLLLADLPNSKAVMSIKLPHYLLIGLPIIALVPVPSAVADVVRETGAGYVVPITSNWQAQFIDILRGRSAPPAPQRNEQAIEALAWNNLSQRWMDALMPVHSGGKVDR